MGGNERASIDQIPEIAPLLEGADHVDIKVVEGAVTLRQFVAALFSYQPGWITFLYRVRAVFVRLLGMRQEGMPRPMKMRPEDVPMTPGGPAAFFTVVAAQEDRYLFAEVVDTHLTAKLGVVVAPLDHERRRFYVVTVVHYHKWTGPVYFNVIRPFHHLVVGRMARAGVRGG